MVTLPLQQTLQLTQCTEGGPAKRHFKIWNIYCTEGCFSFHFPSEKYKIEVLILLHTFTFWLLILLFWCYQSSLRARSSTSLLFFPPFLSCLVSCSPVSYTVTVFGNSRGSFTISFPSTTLQINDIFPVFPTNYFQGVLRSVSLELIRMGLPVPNPVWRSETARASHLVLWQHSFCSGTSLHLHGFIVSRGLSSSPFLICKHNCSIPEKGVIKKQNKRNHISFYLQRIALLFSLISQALDTFQMNSKLSFQSHVPLPLPETCLRGLPSLAGKR